MHAEGCRLVPIDIGLVGTLGVQAKVVSLSLGQLGQLGVDVV
jgi:hypothetical protein